MARHAMLLRVLLVLAQAPLDSVVCTAVILRGWFLAAFSFVV
jgi:hypothetical protein